VGLVEGRVRFTFQLDYSYMNMRKRMSFQQPQTTANSFWEQEWARYWSNHLSKSTQPKGHR